MSIPFPLEDPGLFIAFGLCNVGVKPEDLESSIEAEIQKVKKDLITETEFQKIRNQVESEYVTRNSTVQGNWRKSCQLFCLFR